VLFQRRLERHGWYDGLTEDDGPSKLQDMKQQDMTMADQMKWLKIAKHETAGQKDIHVVLKQITLQCSVRFKKTQECKSEQQVKLYMITE